MKLQLAILALSSLFACPRVASAQNRWVVGPGGFATLEAAYQAAAPGDVILIRAPSLTVQQPLSGKGLRIIGDGITPRIDPNWANAPYPHHPRDLSIENVPRGQVMYLEGLWINGELLLSACDGGIICNRLLVHRSSNDARTLGIHAVRVEYLLCLDSELRGSEDLVPPCYGGVTTPGMFTYQANTFVTRCTIVAGPTGIYSCSPTPPVNRLFQPEVALSIYGGLSPYSRFRASIDHCLLLTYTSSVMRVTWDTVAISGLPQGAGVDADLSELEDYGVQPSVSGTAVVRNHGRALPSFQSTLTTQDLRIQGRGADPGTPVLLGASIRGGYLALEGLGHFGASVLELSSPATALLDTTRSDALGTWTRAYSVNAQMRQLLEFELVILQEYNIDSSGRIWASNFDLVRF